MPEIDSISDDQINEILQNVLIIEQNYENNENLALAKKENEIVLSIKKTIESVIKE